MKKKCLPCILHGCDRDKLFLWLIEGGRGEDTFFLVKAKGRLAALMKMNPKENYELYLSDCEPEEGKKLLSYPRWVTKFGQLGTQIHEIKEEYIYA